MTPYLFVFFILTLCSFSPFIQKGEGFKVPLLVLNFILLFLFAGLRKSGVGPDDAAYIEKFLQVPDLTDWLYGNFSYSFAKIYMEPLYIMYGALIRIFTDNYVFLFVGVSFLSVGLAVHNYYRYSYYVFLTLLLFFVHTFLYRDINQIRSAIAAAVGLFLIAQIHKREHFKVFLTLFFASLFHMASLTLLFAYFISFLKLTRKRAVATYLLSLLFGLIGVSQLVFQLIPGGGVLAKKLYSYTENESYVTAVSLFDITNVKNSAILLIVIIFWKRLERVVPYFATIILFYLLAVGIRIAFWDLGVLAARTSTFFAIVEVILIPYFVFLFRNKFFVTSLIVLYAFLTLYLNLFVKEGRNPYELSIF